MSVLDLPTRRRGFASVAIFCATTFLTSLAFSVPVLAQDDPDGDPVDDTVVTSTTEAGRDGVTSTTTSGNPSTTTSSSTTSIPVLPSTIPPSPDDDPFTFFGEELQTGSYGSQGPFDPLSKAVLWNELSAARIELADTKLEAVAAAETAEERLAEIRILESVMDQLDADAQARIREANESRAVMLERVTEAFVRGNQEVSLLMTLGDPVLHSSATRFLQSLADDDLEAAIAYETAAAALNAEEAEIAGMLEPAQKRYDEAVNEGAALLYEVDKLEEKVEILEAGSHIYVPDMVFPIVGEVHFIDSWGFARLAGTGLSHWHEGIDIMAPVGRELVAVEPGVIERIGTAGLGGNRLWLRGDSGNDYYYAHMSGYAASISEGGRVKAGQLLGYVGDSGSAAGGPPHLHFQIHPGGEDERPVNPFPILNVAYGDRPNLSQAEALAGPSLAFGTQLLGELGNAFGLVATKPE